MQTAKILISALVGTTAMTLFSYIASKTDNRDYREPEILGELIERLPISTTKDASQMTGWLAHYVIGILFVAFFSEVWKRKGISPSLSSGVWLGAASGVVGVISWKGMFESHPNPPKKNLYKHFSHLMLAHVVFGVCSALTYRLSSSNRNA